MSFFQNKQSWPLVDLKEVSTLKRGYDLPVSQREEGSVPIYAANGENGSHNEIKIQGPGVVTGRSGTIGKVHYVESGFWPLNTSLYVTNFHGNCPRWVFYMLTAFKLERFGQGAGVPTLNRNLVHGEKIPLPPLAEQKKIAAILDAADQLRQKDQQLINHYTSLSQSLFLEMFGDPVRNPMGFAISKLSNAYVSGKDATKCGPFGSALKKDEYVENGVPVWVMDNIRQSEFAFDNSLFITPEKYDELEAYSTQSGDIIISRAGTVGKMCIIPEGYSRAIISTNLIRLRLNPDILLPIYFVLLMEYFGDRVGRMRTGPDGAFTHMNTGVLNNLEFPLPPIAKQRTFAKYLSSIENQKNKARYSLVKSEALFNSLLQRAFKGELTSSKAA